MKDSIFAFTDYPIRFLIGIGLIGGIVSSVLGLVVLFSYILGAITVPGYAATMLVVLFLGTFNLFALGLVGTYAWRGYENSKRRPLDIIARVIQNHK